MHARLNTVAVAAVATCALMAGCAGTPPANTPARLGLKLAPAALGASIEVQQHLKVEREGRIDELDVALQVEPEAIDMIGLAFGQRVLTIHYDGSKLTSWRHVMLPSQVRADDVLEDMQMSLWPIDSIARALPAGWQVSEHGRERTLTLDGAPVMRITYSGEPRWSGTVVLDNLRYHYRITINFAPAGT